MVLALCNAEPEFKLANVLVLLEIHVVTHVLDLTLDQELVELQSFTQNGRHLDHTELALCNVELEFKSANVLALLVTHAEHHV